MFHKTTATESLTDELELTLETLKDLTGRDAAAITGGIDVKNPSSDTTGRGSRRLGAARVAAAAVLSALILAGAGASLPVHGSAKPSSGYTQIDTSDHPTNPTTCRSALGC